MEDTQELMKTEPVTKEQVAVLQRMAGLGAILIDWDIDYEVGRGILSGQNRCLWSKDGRRITIIVGDAFVLSQADEPDPVYLQLKQAATEKE